MSQGLIRGISFLIFGSLVLLRSVWAQERPLQGGTPQGLPGYSMGPGGQLIVGSEPKRRVLQCIERQLGVRIHWQALPTKRALQWVQEARLDLAFPMGFTAERARSLRQSAPVWDNPDVWLSRRPLRQDDKRLRLAARLGSPQQTDQIADGFGRMVGYYSYEELVRVLAMDLADAVVVPQSVYEDLRARWPADTQVTLGRPRSTGFYLPPDDPRGLSGPLDRAIQRCRNLGPPPPAVP